MTKTHGRPFYRTIAIPQYLATFIVNEGINGPLPITEARLRGQIGRLVKETGIEFSAKTGEKTRLVKAV